MKNPTRVLIMLFLAFVLFNACEDYVTNIDPLIDAVEDERLSTEKQLNFVINGVKTKYAQVQDDINFLSGLLSDELIYSANLQGASFPSYQEINEGVIELDNNSVDAVFNPLGELRFFADDLIRRTNEVNPNDAALKNKALFNGNLYGGIARYFYASYFGLTETQGGGVIDNGPFIPSTDMYALAIGKFEEALNYVDSDYESRVLHTWIAKCYLALKDYTRTAVQANQGLQEGDAPFQALYSPDLANGWWGFAGAGRVQIGVDFRFKDYIDANPEEANRIIILPTPAIDPNQVQPYGTYFRQAIYEEQSSPINVLTWQENHLIRAEMVLHGTGSGDALALVNAVRASHNISPLGSIDLEGLFVEREKELFTKGTRLIDQHRLDRWHLGTGTWRYLPITRRERANNPNID